MVMSRNYDRIAPPRRCEIVRAELHCLTTRSALCGGLAVLLHLIVGTDPLTAYLATSPGGADSVAIIAASSNVDVPFVMAMQMARFILVLLVGPALARAVARWTKS